MTEHDQDAKSREESKKLMCALNIGRCLIYVKWRDMELLDFQP